MSFVIVITVLLEFVTITKEQVPMGLLHTKTSLLFPTAYLLVFRTGCSYKRCSIVTPQQTDVSISYIIVTNFSRVSDILKADLMRGKWF